MRRLIAELDPPATVPLTIHVAGTNGKGSVCACIDAVARAHGLKTGLFTSPHLVRFHERIRVNGQPITDDAVERGLTRWRKSISEWDPHPSFFEVTFALALAYFYQHQVDCLVLETGLGGRLDATNALEPRHVSVITPIDYDHTQILGHTLDGIAREKAGIFRAGVPIVSSAQAPEAELALRQAAASLQAPIDFVHSPYEGPLSLLGDHQRANAALALAALAAAGYPLSSAKVQSGLGKVSWLGRFQQIGARHVIDGAHNTAATAVLAETWRQEFGSRRATVIFGCAREKEPANSLASLSSIAERFIFTKINSPRSEKPDSLSSLVSRERHQSASLKDALALADRFEDPILITGSLFLAGEAIALLGGKAPPAPMLQ